MWRPGPSSLQPLLCLWGVREACVVTAQPNQAGIRFNPRLDVEAYDSLGACLAPLDFAPGVLDRLLGLGGKERESLESSLL